MLSSNSSSCCNPNYTPFSENDITSFSSSQSQQQQQDPNYNNFFFSFPNSPQMHFDQYDDVYLHFLDHVSVADWSDKITPSSIIGGGNPNSTAAAVGGGGCWPAARGGGCRPAARGRNMKKDRHSKINTARGPRDRRMRLSLDIARRFFDLQDLLGYDKASRTVDWLLRNSSSAIRALARCGRDGVVEHSSLGLTESCTSEDCGEAVSSSATDAITAAVAEGKNKGGRKGKKGGGVQQKRATIGRESRRKARERARERTSQKRRLMKEREGGGTASAAAGTTTHNFPIYDDEQVTAEEVLCQFNFHDSTNSHEFLQQGEQIAEIEFNGKPWEAYNNLIDLSG